jgi:hypothetical protein
MSRSRPRAITSHRLFPSATLVVPESELADYASIPLEKVTTHRFGLKDVDLAIKSVGGHGVPDVIHASLMPWL